jgi:hypothetical protein
MHSIKLALSDMAAKSPDLSKRGVSMDNSIPKAVLEKAFDKAVTEVTRCYQEESTGSKLVRFDIHLTLLLEDGTEITCNPEGILL